MKYFLILATLIMALGAQASVTEIDGVYGEDNRRDIYQVTNTMHRKLALSTAAMIPAISFKKSVRPNFFNLDNINSLERRFNVCPNENFAQQPSAATCSAFLVGPDTIVTAGHCFLAQGLPEQICKTVTWVFDFDLKTSLGNPTRNIPINNVYLCKKVMAVKLDQNLDYAIIRLDRPVIGRTPLKLRPVKVSSATPLVIISSSAGLPTKVATGSIIANDTRTKFITNLDTFEGSSGGPVFNASSGEVVGFLVQGGSDFVPSNKDDRRSCKVVNRCDDNGLNCLVPSTKNDVIRRGEAVLRIETILPEINKALTTP
jgi:hypothetical protein